MSPARVELRPGYSIPRVIKGGWQLAGGHGAFDRDQAIRGMLRFVDAGLTAFDCADIYTGVEELIGEAIATLRREHGADAAASVRVHTKLVPDLDQLAELNAVDLERIVDRSLKRLQIDQIHLLQFFWWDLSVGDPVGLLSTLQRLQEKGKILHLGTTNFDERAMARFTKAGLDLVSAQVQYSLLDGRPAGPFAQWCLDNRIGLLCFGSLAGGFFSERWLDADDPGHNFENRSLIKYRLIIDEFGGWSLFRELLAVLAAIAQKHRSTISTVAAAWVLDQPGVAATIIGARTAAHLAPTLRVLEIALDSDDLSAIDAVRAKRKGPQGPVYGLEGNRQGPHGQIMKYNLGQLEPNLAR